MMKAVFKSILWILALAALAVALFLAYQWIGTWSASENTRPDEAQEAPLVRTATVGRKTLEKTQTITGTIEAAAAVRIVAEITGVLESFRLTDGTLIEEGVVVEKGERIAIIEHQKLAAALEETRANLKVSESNVRLAEVQLQDAEREKKRTVALYEEGTATERQRDKAATAAAAARAELQLARDRVKQAEAAVRRAELTLDDATLTAPLSGVISQKFVDEGTYVTPQTPLARLVDIQPVEIRGGVPGRFFAALEPGKTQARIEVSAYPDQAFEGLISRLQPQINPATRTVSIAVKIPNSDGRLKPGMFARTTIVLDRRENVPVLPDAALVGTREEPAVMVVEDGQARRRTVKLGMKNAQWNEVLEGVEPDAVVVVRGHHLLEDGMRIRTSE